MSNTEGPHILFFGEKLHALRTSQALSLQQLAALLGYASHSYISELETGKKSPTAEFVLKVARLFSVTTDMLLRDEETILLSESEPKPMSQPFIDRPPTSNEIERLRLLLSTYQDGTGMLQATGKKHGTLPGWRDFERACALVFNGTAVENKFFVDVVFPYEQEPATFYGIDCKMRRELTKALTSDRIYIEVINAANTLWSALATGGITERNYRDEPDLAGRRLIEAIEAMKTESSAGYASGSLLIDQSYYFVLLWNSDGLYQLYQLPLKLPVPDDLTWTCHVSTRRNGSETTRLAGKSDNAVLYEWYGDSGGQFKYYPPVSQAVWVSDPFTLEPLTDQVELGIVAKAKAYFPDLWQRATGE